MKTIYYASVIAKMPRKRKEERFEVRMQGDSPFEAIDALRALIAERNLRGARAASFAGWSCSESEFIDSEGVTQTMVFRSIYQCGASIAVGID